MGHLILRLTIWFLLTANLSVENIIIGIVIAFLLPRSYRNSETLKDWLQALGKIAVTIPQAYMEAFEMLVRPHNEEEIIMERIKGPRSPRLIFLDVFLITFTPKTIVLKYHEEGYYEVHHVRRRLRE
jgi:multicomponent Na+:H+ antiporter subunit E